ncbi:MAG TPA: glycine--tRNA ligase subunit beta [Elusimicrobiota bacterium]|nr:glycine--tRNA ligase subunit beta [Elusimicrobiota bacterium]
MNAKDAILEIGCEELPASFVTLGIQQLESIATESLAEHHLMVASIESYGTPRRLAVCLHGVVERSEDQKRVLVGPPATMAKDADGSWSPAALGFARKQGIGPVDLTIENDRLCAVLMIKGAATRLLLAELFPKWISRMEFPKTMIWEPSRFRFPRPIRWLGAVYGHELVSFSLAGVRSGRWTYGLGPTSAKKVALSPAAKYVGLLKNQCVLVEPAARIEAIRKLADQSVRRIHGHVLLHPALLEQVANLVEHPVAVLGNFEPAYLTLPPEVLITCLEHHQKFFPVTSDAAGGKLLPHFIGIRNGMSVHQDIVKEGYERVLAARLADARFFYEQDRKTTLAAKTAALCDVMFQEKLGNLFEKMERVQQLIAWIASVVPGGETWRAQALRAAELCKADLVTDMVREFPELQGIMARIYALADGEDPAVAQAAEQHYWPMTLSSALPQTDAAAALALADKLDTLAGDFSIGLIPTGSADPYGLRRAAVGILRILEDRRWPVPLDSFVEQAMAALPSNVVGSAGDIRAKLSGFMKQRWVAVLGERGFKPDEIDAILAGSIGVVSEALSRLDALHDVRAKPEFDALAAAFKRSMNIVRQAAKSATGSPDDSADNVVRPELFQEAAEKELHAALEKVQLEVRQHANSKAYGAALVSMVPLREPLDAFFTKVMVMVEDPALRGNRLSLMRRLVGVFSSIADFSKLQNA